MDFDLADDQRLLQDSLGKYTSATYDLERRRAYLALPEGHDPANWQTLAKLGVLALPFDPADGGLGGGLIDMHVVMEAFGAALCVEPYVSAMLLGGALLQACGSPAQRVAHLAPMIAGGPRLALAHAEADGRFAWQYCATTAASHNGSYLLHGHKVLVLHAAGASTLLVLARTQGDAADRAGLSLFLVPADTPGVRITPYRTVDGQPAADVMFANAVVPAGSVLGELGHAADALEQVLARACLALCSEALGAMDMLLAQTLEYVKNRVQFGQPIGRFQVIQHRMADMYTGIEQARSLVLRTLLEQPAQGSAWLASVAGTKAVVSETALKVGHEAVQMHGGMGVTDALPIGHYHKRLVMISMLFGDAAFQLARNLALR